MKQVEQIRNAPVIYFQALKETIRREKYSSLYKEVKISISNWPPPRVNCENIIICRVLAIN